MARAAARPKPPKVTVEYESLDVPPRYVEGETELRDAARAEWDAIAAHVSEEVRSLAEEFTALCERIGVLNCGSGCAVDDMGSDGVLFDWNDGHLPILSVMIRSGPQVVYSGKFKNGGRVSGTDSDLSFVAQALTRMMEEWGWPNELDKRLVIAQALGEASRYRALDPPITVAKPAQPT